MDFKNQHFVPESYIKAWRDPKTPQGAYVWTLPKEGGTPRRGSPSNLFSREDFYTVLGADGSRILELEERLHEVETQFMQLRAERIAKRLPLRPIDRRVIAVFAATLYARTEFQKNEQVALWRNALETIDKYPSEILRIVKETEAYRAIEHLHEQPMPFHMFNFVNLAAPFLLLMNCAILETKVESGFTTSDNPVIWQYTVNGRSNQNLPFGLGNISLSVLLPISPDKFLHLERGGPNSYLSVDDNPKWLENINGMTLENADKLIVMNREGI